MSDLERNISADDPTIIQAHVTEITDAMRDGCYDVEDLPRVMAAFSNNTEKKLFTFYPDEVEFTADEFIGLTHEQALKLKEKKMNSVE